MAKIQRDDIPGYEKLLNNLDANRRKAIQSIVRHNDITWQRIMYNKNMSPNDKREQFKKLNDTTSLATKKICDLIKNDQVRAREHVDKLDNSDLIANIIKQLQNAIDEQEGAAIALVQMIKTLPEDISNIYRHSESIFTEIDARVNSKS